MLEFSHVDMLSSTLMAAIVRRTATRNCAPRKGASRARHLLPATQWHSTSRLRALHQRRACARLVLRGAQRRAKAHPGPAPAGACVLRQARLLLGGGHCGGTWGSGKRPIEARTRRVLAQGVALGPGPCVPWTMALGRFSDRGPGTAAASRDRQRSVLPRDGDGWGT